MPASLDCVLCLTRQSLEAARFATSDERRHAAVLKAAFQIVQDIGFTQNPPLVAQEIQRVIRKETGNPDPYSKQKQTSNELMLSVRDEMRQRIRNAAEPLPFAVKLAAAGNTIDYAVKGDWNKETIMQAFETALLQPVNGSIETFTETLSQAKSVLYLLDNCGEIVCDQLLIEEIQRQYPNIAITAVVRGLPVLNDAVMNDAIQIGLDKTVRVIDNGSDAVGTVLEQSSAAFHEALHSSGMLIAKGL
ncbi:MAG: ARMT1-like domain-containing protein, partial [Planctomycetaceae bacterium]|nr:ARMT1-like domain-containing protein [Planctomycetaceae bacterium]